MSRSRVLASKLFTENFQKRFRRQLFHRFPYTRTSTHYFNLLVWLLIKVTSMLPANVVVCVGDPVTVTRLGTWQSNQHIDVVNITVTFFETDLGMKILLKGKTLYYSVNSLRNFVPDCYQNIITIFLERMNTLVTKFLV